MMSSRLQDEAEPARIAPLPEWKRELQDRVDAYRARQPPGRTAGSATRLLRFPPVQEARQPREILADPVRAPATPAPLAARDQAKAATLGQPTVQVRYGGNPGCLPLPLPMAPSSPPTAAALPRALAPLADRWQAGAVDVLLVIAAAVLFALTGWASQGCPAFSLTQLRPLLPAAAAVPGVLGALYLLLCGYGAGGITIGMRCLGLRVASLDGPLTPAAGRLRAWAGVVSLAALGLGFAWMFCDSQHLSWHDLISRTCVVTAPGEE
ncbi:MAG: RDD family protein [Terriglobales bacterium]